MIDDVSVIRLKSNLNMLNPVIEWELKNITQLLSYIFLIIFIVHIKSSYTGIKIDKAWETWCVSSHFYKIKRDIFSKMKFKGRHDMRKKMWKRERALKCEQIWEAQSTKPTWNFISWNTNIGKIIFLYNRFLFSYGNWRKNGEWREYFHVADIREQDRVLVKATIQSFLYKFWYKKYKNLIIQ